MATTAIATRENAPGHLMQNLLLRGITIVGLAGIALIHLIDLPDKLEEAPAIGLLYIGLIAASLITAAALVAKDSRITWAAAAGLAIATIAGFVLSRTIGLPGAGTEDVGNWLEPLGIASLFVEVCTGLAALWGMRRSLNA